jgi:hypothetical protein
MEAISIQSSLQTKEWSTFLTFFFKINIREPQKVQILNSSWIEREHKKVLKFKMIKALLGQLKCREELLRFNKISMDYFWQLLCLLNRNYHLIIATLILILLIQIIIISLIKKILLNFTSGRKLIWKNNYQNFNLICKFMKFQVGFLNLQFLLIFK